MSVRVETSGLAEFEELDGETESRYARLLYHYKKQREKYLKPRKSKPTPLVPSGGGPAPQGNAPVDQPFPPNNPTREPWSASNVQLLWDLVTASARSKDSLTIGQWIVGLNRSAVARSALGFPNPQLKVNETTPENTKNRNYAVRLYGDAIGTNDTLTLARLINYLGQQTNPLSSISTDAIFVGSLPLLSLKL